MSELSFGVRLLFSRWKRPNILIAVSPSLFSTFLVVLRHKIMPRRCPLIVWVQDIYTLGLAETREGNILARWVTSIVEGYTLRQADSVVVIHERFARYISAQFGVQNVRVVRNWTHLEDVRTTNRAAVRSMLGWPTDVPLVVHTGNMGVKQGLENVVDAARLADKYGADIHFVLVGDGAEKSRIAELACGVQRLTLCPPLSEEQYRLALSTADILLVNEKEGVAEMAVPSKLTSYFHAGRPVIAATDPGGIAASEIASACAGIVVQAGEPHQLLDAALELSNDPARAELYGRNARRYRDDVLDEQTAISGWISIIDSVTRPR